MHVYMSQQILLHWPILNRTEIIKKGILFELHGISNLLLGTTTTRYSPLHSINLTVIENGVCLPSTICRLSSCKDTIISN